jgi:probable rRNA maturation factor
MDPVEVFVADEQAEVQVDALRWVRLARLVLEEQGVRGDAELSMLFVDEKSMADLNERFLGRAGPTDVLAFPMDDDVVLGGRQPDEGGRGPGAPAEPTDPPVVLGDVVVCPRVAQRQAQEHGHALGDEVDLLVVHGVLHLLNYDHAEEGESAAMKRRERELLDRFRALEED